MIELSSYKELLMPAPWAVRANFVFAHPAGNLKATEKYQPPPIKSHHSILSEIVQ
jgi:hypothetical protein